LALHGAEVSQTAMFFGFPTNPSAYVNKRLAK